MGEEWLYKAFLLVENKKIRLVKVKQISWEYKKESGEWFLNVMGNYFSDVGFQSYLVGPHVKAL